MRGACEVGVFNKEDSDRIPDQDKPGCSKTGGLISPTRSEHYPQPTGQNTKNEQITRSHPLLDLFISRLFMAMETGEEERREGSGDEKEGRRLRSLCSFIRPYRPTGGKKNC